jgi:hypothetical protein
VKRKELTGILGCVALLLFAVVAWAAPVPDTGLTICYNATVEIPCPSPGQPFYGQDANYTINPMSYTKLDGSGNALSDTAMSWVMVKDNVTGLIWEMKTNKDGVKNYNDPHDADNTYTWYDSNPATNGGNAGFPGNGTDTEDFIKALNDANHGGYSDWRMPTIKELAYIVNYGIPYPGPTINTTYFPNTAASWYWSSTTYAGSTGTAWYVHFYYGYGYYYSKDHGTYARAVRGGQSGSFGNLVIKSFDSLDSGPIDDAMAAAGSYTDNGDGTVTDTSTGLMWQQAVSSNSMTWEQALTHCEGLNLGGHTDWRLPTIKELRSLVDYSQYNPAINTTYFPNTAASWCWSSTTDAGTAYYAWLVHFGYGFDLSSYNYKYYDYYARAVRGGQPGLKASPPTACTATLDGNLLLYIPFISYDNPASGMLSLWADFVYAFNPTYPTLISFKLSNADFINNPSFFCGASTLSADLKIHIPDILLTDGITHLWVDLEYSAALSTDGNFYWVVSGYGPVSN